MYLYIVKEKEMKRLEINIILIFLSLVVLVFYPTCSHPRKKKFAENFNYHQFRDSLSIENYNPANDTSNLFDGELYNPLMDSGNLVFRRIDSLWYRDIAMMQADSAWGPVKKGGGFTAEEKENITANIKTLDSFLLNIDTVFQVPCQGKECALYADVIKSSQKLYLYIDGELVDSFKVSTGIKKRETPEMDLSPRGPLFKKYKSKKFPGGNYMGLGNMPYAVFLKGGYAIHGTTPGNFAKLGTKASHGCIRLHPNNAIIFYELVKKVGLSQTWVTVRDSIP